MDGDRIARVRELFSEDYTSLTASTRSEIEALYVEVTGKRFRRCNCRDRYRDAVMEIYSTLKKQTKMASKSRYRLKAGVVFDYEGVTYSNANLTDEVAAVIAKKWPKRFEVIPEEVAEAAAPEEVAEVAEEPAESVPAEKPKKTRKKSK